MRRPPITGHRHEVRACSHHGRWAGSRPSPRLPTSSGSRHPIRRLASVDPGLPSTCVPSSGSGSRAARIRHRLGPTLRPRVGPGGATPSSATGQPVGCGLLRSGSEDDRDHANLAVDGAPGRAGVRPARHALRSHSHGSCGSASRILTGRAVVAGRLRLQGANGPSRAGTWPARQHAAARRPTGRARAATAPSRP